MTIGAKAQSHECDSRTRMSTNQWVWIVDKSKRATLDQCQWCGQRFERDNSDSEFFIWGIGYAAAKADATHVIMGMPEPSQMTTWAEHWTKESVA